MVETRKWTIKETLLSKTRVIIILTIILTIGLNKLITHLMTRTVTIEHGLYSSVTHHFTLGMYGLVLLIPAAIVSILVVWLFLNKLRRKLPKTIHIRNEFIWYSMYGMALGILIYFLFSNIGGMIAKDIIFNNYWDELKWFSIVVLIPAILGVLTAKLSNLMMIRLTKTNARLINEIENGIHKKYLSNEEKKNKVLKQLKKGNVSSILGALFLVTLNDYIKNTMKFIWYVMLFILLVIALFGSGGGSSSSSSGGRGTSLRERRDKAELALRKQREKTAYSGKQFVNQYRYNRNTIFTKNRADDYIRNLRKEKELEDEYNRYL